MVWRPRCRPRTEARARRQDGHSRDLTPDGPLRKALLAFDPVEGGGHAEDAHEGAGGLLVAGGDGAPLLEPGPEALDQVAVVVDVVGAGDRFLVALGRDRGPRAHVPDMLPE